MEIEDLAEHCERQIDRLPKTSKESEEHLLTLAIIKTNRKCFEELDKKDKQIDLMSKYWNAGLAKCDNCDKIVEKYKKNKCQDCIKQYFVELVEKE